MKSPYGRPLLKLPWSVNWPKLAAESELEVQTNLAQLLLLIGWKRKLVKKSAKKAAVEPGEMESTSALETTAKGLGTSDVIVGFNKVCRSLRKGELCLAVFDPIALQPPNVANTVGLLIHSCQADLAVGTVKNLSTILALQMGLRSVSALGIRKYDRITPDKEENQLVNRLLALLKPVTLASSAQSQEGSVKGELFFL